jgi:CDP-glucose 4,6-dehydratase
VKIPPAVTIDREFWARRRVLLTGHTGFKGAWLSLWLQALGAEVSGLAPAPPTSPSLFELAAVGAHMRERRLDVRDARALADALADARPEVVFHLAAQPMVRRSLADPALTYQVNVMGTVNLLEAVRSAAHAVRAVVVVTSDKCYAQPAGEPARPFVETDPLGGGDPYSSSKACAELVTEAYRRAYFAPSKTRDGERTRVSSARAGNVIGGGDWGEDRLLADIARAASSGEAVMIRNPHAVRPWQHVLNPLSGYLRLAEELYRGDHAARAWNFGPPPAEAREVRWVVERVAEMWKGRFTWQHDKNAHPPEAAHLSIDSRAAERELRWRPRWSLERGLEAFVQWHEALREGADMREVSLAQLADYARG